MKIKLVIITLMFSLPAIAHKVGENVKCQGYLEDKSKERNYYTLEGKVLKDEGRHILIYGYTPVLSSKRLHKVLKISCVKPQEDFIESVTEVVTKEEPVEAEVVTTPPEISELGFDPPVKKAEDHLSDYPDDDEEEEEIIVKKIDTAPINNMDIRQKKISKSKTSKKKSDVASTKKKDDSSCSDLISRDTLQIIKCFIKDGYGSI